jgi:thiol-disulfide isomerase/thioredoxin
MKIACKTALVATAFILAAGSSALAQQSDVSVEIQELKGEMAELKQEIAALKTELQKMRGEMSKTVAALRAGQQRQQRPRQRPAEAMVGKEAPTFSVTTVDGDEMTIGGKREKPQVLFCWASWCPHCKHALPWIEQVHEKYKDKGVDVLAVNLDARGTSRRARTEEQTLKTYEALNLTMPMTMTTDNNDTQKIQSAYKATSFPTLFVLGPSGEVESVHIGAKQGLENIVAGELDVLLAGKTRADFPTN